MNGCLMPVGSELRICWIRWMTSVWPLLTSAPQFIPQAHRREALPRLGLDELDVADGAHRLLDGVGDGLLDVEHTGARVDGPDVDDREVDVREEIDREPPEGHEAEDGHGQRRHQDGDGVAQREQRHPHATSSPPRGPSDPRAPAPYPRR